MGLLQNSTHGLGVEKVKGRRRVPNPPTRMIAFIVYYNCVCLIYLSNNILDLLTQHMFLVEFNNRRKYPLRNFTGHNRSINKAVYGPMKQITITMYYIILQGTLLDEP
jgi:hypothetical protein